MEKVKKQIVVNLVVIFISLVVIWYAKGIREGHFFPLNEYIGSDFVFVMITTLIGVLGWRFVESIVVNLIYNSIVVVYLVLLILTYGTTLAADNMNSFLWEWTCSLAVAFLVFYFLENLFVVIHFMKIENKEDIITYNTDKEI